MKKHRIKLILSVGIILVATQCKPPKENLYIRRLDSLVTQADSLNRLLTSIKVDSIEKMIQETMVELNERWVTVIETGSLQKHLPSINKYRALYLDFDSCMISCADFFGELHLIHYELNQVRENYLKGMMTDTAVQTMIKKEKILLEEISQRIKDKTNIISYYTTKIEEAQPGLHDLMISVTIKE